MQNVLVKIARFSILVVCLTAAQNVFSQTSLQIRNESTLAIKLEYSTVYLNSNCVFQKAGQSNLVKVIKPGTTETINLSEGAKFLKIKAYKGIWVLGKVASWDYISQRVYECSQPSCYKFTNNGSVTVNWIDTCN